MNSLSVFDMKVTGTTATMKAGDQKDAEAIATSALGPFCLSRRAARAGLPSTPKYRIGRMEPAGALRLAEAPVDPVAGAEVAADPGQEPRIARIERMIGKFRPVEGVGAVHLAGDLAGRLVAEISHHRDA